MPGTGTVNVDFGAFPGTDKASVAITGQASIASGSLVEAWIRPIATADHSEDEVVMLTRFVSVSVPNSLLIAGTGFTIAAVCDNGPLHGLIPLNWAWA